jgi:hypothetical protein
LRTVGTCYCYSTQDKKPALHLYTLIFKGNYITEEGNKWKTCPHPDEVEWDSYINTKQIQ